MRTRQPHHKLDLGPYAADQRKLMAPPPPIPLVALEVGDQVGYARSTSFDPTRRGVVEGFLGTLVDVRWDGAPTAVFVERATLVRAYEQTRAWAAS